MEQKFLLMRNKYLLERKIVAQLLIYKYSRVLIMQHKQHQ